MTNCKDVEEKPGKTIDTQCGMTLFGFPITWTENIPVGDIVLADRLTYLKFKKKAEDDDPEVT